MVESTKQLNCTDITSFPRLPIQVRETDEHPRPAGRKGQAVRGVLALCTDLTDDFDVDSWVPVVLLSRSGDFSDYELLRSI